MKTAKINARNKRAKDFAITGTHDSLMRMMTMTLMILKMMLKTEKNKVDEVDEYESDDGHQIRFGLDDATAAALAAALPGLTALKRLNLGFNPRIAARGWQQLAVGPRAQPVGRPSMRRRADIIRCCGAAYRVAAPV